MLKAGLEFGLEFCSTGSEPTVTYIWEKYFIYQNFLPSCVWQLFHCSASGIRVPERENLIAWFYACLKGCRTSLTLAVSNMVL